MTLDEFLCAKNQIRADGPNEFTTSAEEIATILMQEMNITSFRQLRVLRTCGDYCIVRLNETDTGLIDPDCNLAGYYIGEALVIDQDHRRQDLSIPLILTALPQRPIPNGRKVSAAGEAALRKAWRVANGHENCQWWE
jgi:hypothetical protein